MMRQKIKHSLLILVLSVLNLSIIIYLQPYIELRNFYIMDTFDKIKISDKTIFPPMWIKSGIQLNKNYFLSKSGSLDSKIDKIDLNEFKNEIFIFNKGKRVEVNNKFKSSDLSFVVAFKNHMVIKLENDNTIYSIFLLNRDRERKLTMNPVHLNNNEKI